MRAFIFMCLSAACLSGCAADERAWIKQEAAKIDRTHRTLVECEAVRYTLIPPSIDFEWHFRLPMPSSK